MKKASNVYIRTATFKTQVTERKSGRSLSSKRWPPFGCQQPAVSAEHRTLNLQKIGSIYSRRGKDRDTGRSRGAEMGRSASMTAPFVQLNPISGDEEEKERKGKTKTHSGKKRVPPCPPISRSGF